jgi:hypothetical protein
MELDDDLVREVLLERLRKTEQDRLADGASPALNVALTGPIAWTVYQSTSYTCTLEEAAAAANAAVMERGNETPTLMGYLEICERAISIIQDWA